MHFIALCKPGERYILLHDGTEWARREAINVLARWAADGELGFTLADAVTLSDRVRSGAETEL